MRPDFWAHFGESGKGVRRTLYNYTREIVANGDPGMIGAIAPAFSTKNLLNFRDIRDSSRLENFREGMEDYEYLFKLRELLSKYENNSTNIELNEYRQLLNPENYLLYKYPRKTKVTLENTIRYPDQPERILETRQKIALAIEYLQKRLSKN